VNLFFYSAGNIHIIFYCQQVARRAYNKTLVMHHQQTTTNANYQHQLSAADVQKIVSDLVFEELTKSLWYRIQCVGCDEAAEKLDCKPDTVRDMIKRGDLAASKIGNNWSIRLVDIDALLRKNATVVNHPAVYKPRRKNILNHKPQ
jgi:excisionase family DNA binding protein